VKLFYNPTSRVPLIWSLLVLILGQLIAHAILLLMRVGVHGTIYYNSFYELPKLDFLDSRFHYILWLTFILVALSIAGVSLLASAFSFKSWWIRILYVLLVSMTGLVLVVIIQLSYYERTGLNWK